MSRHSDTNKTFQVRIDAGWWKILADLHADSKDSFKSLVEAALQNTYGIDKNGNPYLLK